MKLITLESILVWETSLITWDEVSLDKSWANLGLEIDNSFRWVTFDHHYKAGMGVPSDRPYIQLIELSTCF